MAEKHNKLTLETLIARKQQGELDKLQIKNIYVKSLDGELTVKKLPLATILNLMDAVDENSGMVEQLEVNKELIYKACPMLQDKQLQDEYGCSEPYDIVPAVFNDNIVEIGEFASEILDFYGLGDSSGFAEQYNKLKN